MPESSVGGLLLRILTPRGVVFERRVRSIRVPTETGQVGLRPGGEPSVLAVEPGLILLQTADETRFVGSAGGLLESARRQCSLYTPFAVEDTSPAPVLHALEAALETPNSELEARKALGELEQQILREVRERTPAEASIRSHRG